LTKRERVDALVVVSARAALLACVGTSVLAHAALVGYLALSGGGEGAARPQPQGHAAAMQVRVAMPSPAAIAAAGSGALVEVAAASLDVGPGQLSKSGIPVQPQPPASAPAPASATVSLPVSGSPWFDEEAYLPRPKLTVPPVAQQAVLLSWPEQDAPPAGQYVGVLSLFIDEFGAVQRVRVEGDDLPAPLRERARAAFAGLRFSPGQVQGQEVKSRIRVEVRFDADPRMVRGAAGS
jgi:hypothetical protein